MLKENTTRPGGCHPPRNGTSTESNAQRLELSADLNYIHVVSSDSSRCASKRARRTMAGFLRKWGLSLRKQRCLSRLEKVQRLISTTQDTSEKATVELSLWPCD